MVLGSLLVLPRLVAEQQLQNPTEGPDNCHELEKGPGAVKRQGDEFF